MAQRRDDEEEEDDDENKNMPGAGYRRGSRNEAE